MKARYKKNKKLMKMLKNQETKFRGDFGVIGQWTNGACIDNGILRYLKKKFDIKTMIDVGCGEGKQVEYAKKIGIRAIGVDGCPALSVYKKSHFIQHDYTTGKVDLGEFDLGWSVEFLEHVYEKYIPNFMNTLMRCNVVLCTHAVPGQRGTHHVNCQASEYWIAVFREYGFKYDSARTARIRKTASMSHIRKKGLLFRKTCEKTTL